METIEHWITQAANIVWVGQLAILLLLALLFHFLEARYFEVAIERLKKTPSVWDDAVLIALHRPAKYFIWLVTFTLLGDSIKHNVPMLDFLHLMPEIRLYGTILLLVWVVLGLISQVEHNLCKPRRGGRTMDPTNARAVSRTLRVILVVLTVLVMLNTAGVDLSGLLTFGGVGTLVVGLASQQLLANYFSGFVIFLDKPFKVGDWIMSPDRDIEGVVEEIGWRLTRIRSFERRPMYVPNSVFSSITVKNPSRMYNRRIKETVGVRYDDAKKVRSIVEGIRTMLREHPDIDQKQFCMVHFLQFGASSLDISIYCFTKTTVWDEYRGIQEDVLLKVLDIIEAHGAECAFPTRTLHLPDGLELMDGKAGPEGHAIGSDHVR